MPGPSDNNQAELQHAPVCQSHKDCQLHWYAVRVTYSRELSLKDYLDKENIENFIPMRYEYVIRNERRVRKLVPPYTTWYFSVPPVPVSMKSKTIRF